MCCQYAACSHSTILMFRPTCSLSEIEVISHLFTSQANPDVLTVRHCRKGLEHEENTKAGYLFFSTFAGHSKKKSLHFLHTPHLPYRWSPVGGGEFFVEPAVRSHVMHKFASENGKKAFLVGDKVRDQDAVPQSSKREQYYNQ